MIQTPRPPRRASMVQLSKTRHPNPLLSVRGRSQASGSHRHDFLLQRRLRAASKRVPRSHGDRQCFVEAGANLGINLPRFVVNENQSELSLAFPARWAMIPWRAVTFRELRYCLRQLRTRAPVTFIGRIGIRLTENRKLFLSVLKVRGPSSLSRHDQLSRIGL